MPSPTIQDLLLAPELDFRQVSELLSPYGFEEIRKADANLQLIADEPNVRKLFAGILEECVASLADSADPDQGLNHFERFTRSVFSKTHLFSYLRNAPGTLSLCMKIFGGSPFLSEILIRNPEYFYWVFDPRVLSKERKKGEIARELSASLRLLKNRSERLDLIRIIKRKEILLIGARDLLRESTVEETLRELSDLAEVLIRSAYKLCEKEMIQKYGAPSHKDRSGRRRRRGFTVLAMGKLGGRELNFSSDVDLIYLYASGAGKTEGAPRGRGERLSHAEYFRRLAQSLTAALAAVTDQGYVYRVDLRLRPEGEMGLIAQTLQGYRRYYASRGETWERLSLIKVRPVAGDLSLGKTFFKMAAPFAYGRPFGPKGLQEVKGLKDKIDEKIGEAGQTDIHVKLGYGGIREIEFIVQSLQLHFGRKRGEFREGATIKSLGRLSKRSVISQEDHSLLLRAYLYLRDVENKVQMVHDLQTHLFPTDAKEIRRLALRLGYRDRPDGSASDQLLNDYRFHTDTVHSIFQKVFAAPEGVLA